MTNGSRPTRFSSLVGLWLVSILAAPLDVSARIPEPDFVVYGAATQFGQPLAPNDLITVTLVGSTEPLAEYRMESDPLLGSLFAVRIPMDSVEPKASGTARPGELAQLLIKGQFAAQFLIGEQGHALRLDADPGGDAPNLAVNDIQVVEGSGGTVAAVFTLSLSDNIGQSASVRVDTQSDSAFGGTSCTANVDYVNLGQTVTIAAGQLSATVNVAICGDLIEESEEQFFLNLSSAQGANLADNQAVATITDDDLAPDISVDDLNFAEPTAGTDDLMFTIRLSQAWSDNVMVNYSTSSGTAISSVDFVPTAGTAIIPAGSVFTQVAVTINSDMDVEQNETFSLNLSNPVNGRILDGIGTATLIDLNFDPVLQPTSQVSNGNGDGDLLNPSDLFVTRNNGFAFVSARGSDSIVSFTRNPGDGALTLLSTYTNSVTGFEMAPLDGASSVAATPDNEFLYVSAANNDAIGVYDLDPVTGAITYIGMAGDNGGLNGLDGVSELLISSTGTVLYAAGTTAGAISVFAIDPSTGMLSFVQRLGEGDDTGSGAINGLEQVSGLARSSDDAFLYATGKADNAVSVFSIDPADGTLSHTETHQHRLELVRGIANATDVAMSPDGMQVFVTGAGLENDPESSGVAIFDRDTVTGSLTYMRAIHPGGNGVAAMQGAQAVVIAGDGQTLTVAGFADNSLTVFSRIANALDPSYGELTVSETRRDGEGGNELMAGPSRLSISTDGQYMYVVAQIDNAVSVFKILNFQMIFSASFESP